MKIILCLGLSLSAQSAERPPARNATPAQIVAAKAAGLVWVNLSTKLYYTSTSEFYGATKSGKFMTEKDAIAVGYRKEIAN